jgi:hypothetical protein
MAERMGWLRTNRRWPSGLAVFALALQLALAFGHAHPLSSADTAVTVTASPIDDPAQHRPDDCAICAVIHLAGSLLPPPAAPALPYAGPAAWDDIPPSLEHIAAAAAAFQARGPPLS